MLEIKDLKVKVADKVILNGVNLTIRPGEVHAIMGPNGAGKSTLSAVMAGKPGYEIVAGDILFYEESIVDLEPEERAILGLFLGFQYPVEIPGVNNAYFLKTAVNNHRREQGLDELDAVDFMKELKDNLKLLQMSTDFLSRSLNHGFSGGEKKRNEILQMLMLSPKLAVLDETDSGLDIDALQVVSTGVNSFRQDDRSILMITHYQRLLDHIEPDYIHVMVEGKICKTGDKNLAHQLEEKGYEWLNEKVAN